MSSNRSLAKNIWSEMAVRGKNYQATVEESVRINAPQDVVFDFLSDFSNYTKISDAFHESRQTSKGKVGVGTTGIRKAKFFGSNFEFRQEITEFDPPNKITMRNISPVLETTDELICDKDGKYTDVTLRVTGDTRGFMAIMVSLVLAQTQRQIKKDLQNLKKILESEDM